jgi:hypothetical protein
MILRLAQPFNVDFFGHDFLDVLLCRQTTRLENGSHGENLKMFQGHLKPGLVLD